MVSLVTVDLSGYRVLAVIALGGAVATLMTAARRHVAGSASLRHLLRLALVTSLIAIAGVTLIPAHQSKNELQLRPLAEILAAVGTGDPELILGVVGNILLFAPLGGVLRLQGFSWLRCLALGASISVTIEFIQLAIPGRTTSTDDVFLNAMGVIVGYAVTGRLAVRIRTQTK